MKRENKGLRVKIKGTRAKEKVKRSKEEVQLQIVLRVKNRTYEVFFFFLKICRGTTKDYGEN